MCTEESSGGALGHPRRGGYWANVLLFVGSVLISVLLAEAIVRTVYPQDLSTWTYTRDGLTLHLPNVIQASHRFGHDIAINSEGMRDDEHDVRKPLGVYRILVLGDSFMEAYQVKFEDAFVRMLKRRLQDIDGRAIEVINASVSGWGTDDELTYLMRRGINYRPDLILIAVTLHNDVSDNLLEEYHEFKNGRIEQRPVVVMPWVSFSILKLKEWLASHLHLYQVMLRAKNANWVANESRKLNVHVGGLLRRVPDDRAQAGWEMTRQLLQKMKQTASTINARLVVMLLPLSLQVDQETLPNFLAIQGLKEVDIELFKPQEMMQKIGADVGISIVDLYPVFQQTKAACACALFVQDDGHWNKLGHQIAAEEAAKRLLQTGLMGATLTIADPGR